MSLQIADLHNHTTASDGELTPTELVRTAAEMGASAVGVTDHDTLDGLDEALQAGQDAGITVIPGVEVSIYYQLPYFTGTIHFLLYIPFDMVRDSNFRVQAHRMFNKGRGENLVRTRMSNINTWYGPRGQTPVLSRSLRRSEIGDSPAVTRRHFANALQEHHGLDQTAIFKLIGNNSPAYHPSGVGAGEVRNLYGTFPRLVPVLAHPAAGSHPGKTFYKEVAPPLDTVLSLVYSNQLPVFHGVEVVHPGHTKPFRLFLREWAKARGLLITGGSDSHDRKDRPMGVGHVNGPQLSALKARLRRSP